MTTSTAEGILYCSKKKKMIPYKAQQGDIFNGLPHGDRIRCGHNPWIYARKVSNLIVEANQVTETEILTWQEPPKFKWKDENQSAIVLDREGSVKRLERPMSPVLEHFGLERSPRYLPAITTPRPSLPGRKSS